ncbi:hypothetical protein [Aquimarina megaterium]|uniref:hypothetical protein n=1 Tax=Aquimarina megaterium TaxID=1443666 RepID=UPI0004B9DAFD|nr:hypothetical protein [Aquimarina megaterium]
MDQNFVFVKSIILLSGVKKELTSRRIYRLEDLDELLQSIKDDTYIWKKEIIEGKSEKIYLIGYPKE